MKANKVRLLAAILSASMIAAPVAPTISVYAADSTITTDDTTTDDAATDDTATDANSDTSTDTTSDSTDIDDDDTADDSTDDTIDEDYTFGVSDDEPDLEDVNAYSEATSEYADVLKSDGSEFSVTDDNVDYDSEIETRNQAVSALSDAADKDTEALGDNQSTLEDKYNNDISTINDHIDSRKNASEDLLSKYQDDYETKLSNYDDKISEEKDNFESFKDEKNNDIEEEAGNLSDKVDNYKDQISELKKSQKAKIKALRTKIAKAKAASVKRQNKIKASITNEQKAMNARIKKIQAKKKALKGSLTEKTTAETVACNKYVKAGNAKLKKLNSKLSKVESEYNSKINAVQATLEKDTKFLQNTIEVLEDKQEKHQAIVENREAISSAFSDADDAYSQALTELDDTIEETRSSAKEQATSAMEAYTSDGAADEFLDDTIKEIKSYYTDAHDSIKDNLDSFKDDMTSTFNDIESQISDAGSDVDTSAETSALDTRRSTLESDYNSRINALNGDVDQYTGFYSDLAEIINGVKAENAEASKTRANDAIEEAFNEQSSEYQETASGILEELESNAEETANHSFGNKINVRDLNKVKQKLNNLCKKAAQSIDIANQKAVDALTESAKSSGAADNLNNKYRSELQKLRQTDRNKVKDIFNDKSKELAKNYDKACDKYEKTHLDGPTSKQSTSGKKSNAGKKSTSGKRSSSSNNTRKSSSSSNRRTDTSTHAKTNTTKKTNNNSAKIQAAKKKVDQARAKVKSTQAAFNKTNAAFNRCKKPGKPPRRTDRKYNSYGGNRTVRIRKGDAAYKRDYAAWQATSKKYQDAGNANIRARKDYQSAVAALSAAIQAYNAVK